MNINSQISKNQASNTFQKKMIAGYISEILLFCLIVAYAILSQSLFSSLAILFLIISIVMTIAKPYYLLKSTQFQNELNLRIIKPYQVQKIIWSLFLVLQFLILIFKIAVYFTNYSKDWTQDLQQFFQVQNLQYLFLPTILLPFAGISILIKSKDKNLQDFKKPLAKNILLPLYLILCSLVILIQIFTVSITGLTYFGIMLYIFLMKSFNFQDKLFKWILWLIQCFTTVLIFLNCLICSNYIYKEKQSVYYGFVGLNSIITFMDSPLSRGHIICEFLLSITCAYLNRLFIYQKFNVIYMKIANAEEVEESILFGQSDKKQSLLANNYDQILPQKKIDNQEIRMKISRSLSLPNNKVIGFKQQVELMSRISGRDSFYSEDIDDGLQIQKHLIKNQKKNQELIEKLIAQEIDIVDENIEIKRVKKRNKPNMFERMQKSFLQMLEKVIIFLKSPQFSLRVIEILSIIIIQRYNNIYSLVSLIWLTLVFTFENLKIVWFATAFVMLPMQLANYLITYFYNIPASPAQNVANAQIYGFQFSTSVWLDVLIFNLYFNYIILFLKNYRQLSNKQSFKSKQFKNKKKLKTWEIITAFIFRYTYLLTLIGMFFLGFSQCTLMNLIFVALFLIFFSNGDNLIIIKKRKKGKQVMSITTFSKNYWFVIVYFTIICILAKYIYFLFFDGQLTQQLQPTGINTIYNWSFNFSLSSYCKSNTTPLFIIFVLSQIQIIIYRSMIYTKYSFSLLSNLKPYISNKNKDKKSNFSQSITKILNFINEIYYQTIYYISGFIIIACSYRWSFFGLFIVIFTCYGLLNKFNKKLLGVILTLNLVFLFLNYLIFLVFNYQIIFTTLGAQVMSNIQKISLFIGLTIESDQYASLFILNVVIFYFCVICYKLENILIYKIPESIQNRLKEDNFSVHEETIIDSEFQDEQFAENYKKGVINVIKEYYEVNLIQKYGGLNTLGKYMTFFMTDLISIFVIIECLYFRLSISMLLFLIVYLIFYFSLFDTIGKHFIQTEYYKKIETSLQIFDDKQRKIQQRELSYNLIEDKQMISKLKKFFFSVHKDVHKTKCLWKSKIWIYSAMLSVICLILTYSAQFLTSDFYNQYVNFAGTDNLIIVLFVLGVSVDGNQTFGRQIYFYYVMLFINIVEKLILIYIKKEEIKTIQQNMKAQRKSIKLSMLEDPIYLSNKQQPNFIQEIQFLDQLESEKQIQIRDNFNDEILNQNNKKNYYEQSNLLIYFKYRYTKIRIAMTYGTLNFVIRSYLWLMFINVYIKNNIFALAYLIAILCFWFRSLTFNLIRDINKAAIIILLLQYIALLLDINLNTSPISIPNGQKLSILQYLISNQQWVDFIAVSSYETNNNSFVVSFIINSIIIFLTEICFTILQFISNHCLNLIEEVYNRYEYILLTLSNLADGNPITLNYFKYKHLSHRILIFIYENIIMNSYLLVSLLIFILLAGVHNILSMILLLISFLYIYIGIYSKISQKEAIFNYTRIYFRIFNILQLIIIFLSILLSLPIISQDNQYINVAEEFGALTSLQQIFLILFIQLWLDLNSSQSFKSLSNSYRQKIKMREEIYLKCLAFQKNNNLIINLIQSYKQIINFDININEAMKIIKQWHIIMNKQAKTQVVDYEEEKKQSKKLQKLKEQIKKQALSNDHSQFSIIFKKIIDSNTDLPFIMKYYDILEFISKNLSNIIGENQVRLSVWDFILEDYSFIYKMIKKGQQQMKIFTESVIDFDEPTQEKIFGMNQKLHLQNKELSIKLESPQKLLIDLEEVRKDKNSLNSKILPFLISNFDHFIVLLLQIYYIVNPCVLSFPLVLYLFSYFLLVDNKMTHLIVLYIFLIIASAEIMLMLNFDSNIIKYFFYVQSKDITITISNNVSYQLPYLYFIFLMLFIGQQSNKYKGTKFIHTGNIQNLQQAFLRLLLNENQNSSLYLWKYNNQFQENIDTINPYNISIKSVDNYPQKLTSCDSSFFDLFKNQKIGVDLYPPIAAVQIFLTIYLIFLYPLMVQSQGSSLEQSTKYFQFSSDMVIGVLVHVFSMVIQRRITVWVVQRHIKIIIKYIYTLIILLLFCWFIFYLAPYRAPIYQPTPALIAFSMFYFIYFYLSALQIKYGYTQIKSLNSLMTRRGKSNYYIISIYTAIPFLYQLKIIMDWTFSETSLTLYDWFRQFSIYLNAFRAKIQFINATTTIALGKTMPWYYKATGWIGFILILIIIFGPMVLFSGLNPIAESNLVTGGSMSISLDIINGNSFQLYSTSHFSSSPIYYNQSLFDSQGFNQVPVLQQLTASDIPQQFQSVTYDPFSDNNWGISLPNYYSIISVMSQAINELKNNKTPSYEFQLTANYLLNRQISTTIPVDSEFSYPTVGPLPLTLLTQLYNTLTTCNKSTLLPNFYISLIRLNTIGTTYKPRPIFYTAPNGDQPYYQNVSLTLNCIAGVTNISNTNQVYWSFQESTNTSSSDGITLYVYCDKYQSLTFGYSFTALYTSIILVIAGFVRSLFDGNLPYIPFAMNPKPDNILQICEAIGTLRIRKQFRQEYLMYYQLIDIIRSPEIMKFMSGSYPYLIQKTYDDAQIKAQIEAMQKRKIL